MAQPAPARSGALVLENVLVTAQRKEEGLNDVAISISAYSSEALEKLGVVDTRDLGNLVPGFSFADGGFPTPIYTLRGVGFNENSQTASATVGLYFDEYNLPFPVMSKGPSIDIARLEVLKGPQGTLYGRNTTGGAVNFIPNRPSHNFEYAAKASYSRFDTRDLEGVVSGSVTDNIAVRVAARQVESGEGWQKSRTRHSSGGANNADTGRDVGGAYGRFGYDTLGEQDKSAWRVMLDWDVSEVAKLSLFANGWRDRSEPQAVQVIALDPRSQADGDPPFHGDVASYPLNPFDTDNARAADWPNDGTEFRLNETFVSYGAKLNWELPGDIDLVFLASTGEYESDGSFLPQAGYDVSNSERNIFAETDYYNLELRLSGDIGDDVFWQAGVHYSEDDVFEFQRLHHETVSIVFPVDAQDGDGQAGLDNRSGFDGNQRAEVEAIFLHTEWQFAPEWKLTLAWRYTDEVRTFNGCSRDVDIETQPGADQEPPNAVNEGVGLDNAFTGLSAMQSPAAGFTPGTVESGGCFTLNNETRRPERFFGKLAEDNQSGRIALDWSPVEDVLMYASFSRGYKSGSFPLINISDSIQYTPATQEQLDAIELGSKLTLLDNRLQINVSAFDYQYEDKQLVTAFRDPVFGPLPIIRNAPESQVRGAELEIKSNPITGLFLSLAGVYIDSEVKEFVSGDSNGAEFDFSGKAFNYTPQWEYTLVGDYEFVVLDDYLMSVGLDYRFTDEANASLEQNDTFAIDDYALLNTRMSFGKLDGPWRVSLWGRNITNEYYANNVINQIDSVGRYTGMPEVWGVSLRWEQ